jgi:hypothetical protein
MSILAQMIIDSTKAPNDAKPLLAVRSLSIGNLLKRNGIVVTIDARSIFDIWNDEGIEKLGYKPIPITMEWIEKLGFVFEELGEEPTLEEQSYRKAIRGYGSKAFEIFYYWRINQLQICPRTSKLVLYAYWFGVVVE